MSPLISLLLLALFWTLVSAGGKKKQNPNGKKPAGGTPRAMTNALGPAAAARQRAARKTAAWIGPQADPADAPAAQPPAEAAPARAEAPAAVPAPAHSKYYTGSLGPSEPEGVDPCHDDPDAMVPGSLRVPFPEGTDPCHDDLPRRAETAAVLPDEDEPAGGPALRIPGNEIVRGFVWGEILNRKRA